LPIFAKFLLPISHSAPSVSKFSLEFRAEVNRHVAILQWRPHDRSCSHFGWHDTSVWQTDGQTVGQNLS